MRTSRQGIKTNAIILILLTLFQSCVVYHKTPVTMEDAVQAETKTKVFLKDGRVEKFKSVTNQDGQFYGTRITGNGLVTIPLDVDSISQVQVKNKTASILVTVIPLAALTALVIAAANFSVGGIGW